MLVDPVVVVEVGAAVGRDPLHLGTRGRVQGPALGAVLPGGGGPVQHVAPAAVEAGHVPAARQGGPHDAVGADVDAPRREPLDGRVGVLERRLVVLGDARLGRVVAQLEPHDLPRHAARGGPHHAVRGRVGDDAVPPAAHLLVQGRVDVAGAAHPLGDAAVAVGVDDDRAPALRGLRVAGLLVDVDVEPADDGADRAEVQALAVLVAELQVVGVEAGVDELDVLRRRVVPGDVARRPVQRIVLRIGVVRALAAPRGVAGPANLVGHPHPPLRVHHRVVRVPRVVPDQLVAPVDGGLQVLPVDVRPEVALAGGVAHRQDHLARLVRARVDPHQLVVGELHPVDGAAGVDRRVPLVGRDLVVDVAGRAAPLPQGQHHVALAPPRARRRRGHLAGHDPVGPVGVHRDGALRPEAAQVAVHQGAALPDPHPVRPRRLGRVEVAGVQHLAGRQVPELVAELAALLQAVDPRRLVAHARRDAVAGVAGAGELVLGRHLHQRVPVVGGVDLRRLARVRGRDRVEVERVARPAGDRLGVAEAVAAHPDLVVGVGQVRQHVAPGVVGDHDLAEPGVEVVGLGDHPDPRLGPVGAPHDPADVVGVERPLSGRRRPEPQRRGGHDDQRGHERRHAAETAYQSRLHRFVSRCARTTSACAIDARVARPVVLSPQAGREGSAVRTL